MADEEKDSDSWLQEIVTFYRIPLIFAILSLFLLGGAILIWQSNNKSATVSFIQEDNNIASNSGKIKADIEGSVVNPGVYELNSGSRIQDLLIMAGGLTATADREWMNRSLNQAAKVADGAKIYIPMVNDATVSKVDSSEQKATNELISINSASLSELDTLSGVGPVTAQKIIDGRPYQTIEELVSRKIVGQSVFEKIKEKISLY
ncbi:MAG: ComEA family DNA-binding protein [Candidatus Gottesmanbacteria bacterium]